MENVKEVDYNELIETMCTANPKDKLILVALFDILNHVCHKENNVYWFDADDETDENTKYINSWFDYMHKIVPFSNVNNYKTNKKKVLSFIKHICGKLTDRQYEFNTKVYVVGTDDGKKTTKTKHYIKKA